MSLRAWETLQGRTTQPLLLVCVRETRPLMLVVQKVITWHLGLEEKRAFRQLVQQVGHQEDWAFC